MTIVRSRKKLWYTAEVISSLMLLVLFTAVAFVSVQAQDASEDTTTFISESGFLNFSYPADWSLSVDEDDVVFIANTDAATERLATGQLQTGDVGMNVVLMPAAFIEFFGGSGESSEQALQFILGSPLHAVSDPGNTQISEISAVQLDSGHDASQFSLTTPALDGKVFAIIPAEGVILYITVVGSTDEYASAEEMIINMLGTIDYSGTADDAWHEVLLYPLPV